MILAKIAESWRMKLGDVDLWRKTIGGGRRGLGWPDSPEAP
jgi:hypothetical protein